jgi:hypothetical protein
VRNRKDRRRQRGELNLLDLLSLLAHALLPDIMSDIMKKPSTYPPVEQLAVASLPSPPPTPRPSSPISPIESQQVAHSMVTETNKEKWDRRIREASCALLYFLVVVVVVC